MNKHGFKVFAIHNNGEIDMVAARTVIEALIQHNKITDMWITDFEPTDDVIEVPSDQWMNTLIRYEGEEPELRSLWERMVDINSPEFLSSTLY